MSLAAQPGSDIILLQRFDRLEGVVLFSVETIPSEQLVSKSAPSVW